MIFFGVLLMMLVVALAIIYAAVGASMKRFLIAAPLVLALLVGWYEADRWIDCGPPWARNCPWW